MPDPNNEQEMLPDSENLSTDSSKLKVKKCSEHRNQFLWL